MARIDAFFRFMHEQHASDLHLVSGHPPVLRIHGDIERMTYRVLDDDDLRKMLYEITPAEKIKVFEETWDMDFSYEIPGLARYRGNIFMQKNGIGAVFRAIPNTIPTAEQLGLPPVVSQLALLPRGLVIVAGPTGSGKSTTLAAIIDIANRTRRDHIITIEDPIEFVHQSRKCLVNHREVGRHSRSFSSAIKGALREDPDILLVGEMRDPETIALAVEASAMGHLVLSTLHTTSAVKTVDRIVDVFPAPEQAQIRSTLADGIRAIISQTLFKRIDKKGRIPALEILIATPAVRNLIREAKSHQLPSMIQTGKQYGMQLLDDAIMDLYTRGQISAEDACSRSNEKPVATPCPSSRPQILPGHSLMRGPILWKGKPCQSLLMA